MLFFKKVILFVYFVIDLIHFLCYHHRWFALSDKKEKAKWLWNGLLK